MKKSIILFAILAAIVSCGGANKRATTSSAKATTTTIKPQQYGYKVVSSYPHHTDSYTQGLEFADGELWEGTGQNGQSRLMKVDLKSGKTETIATLSDSEFGEGITILGDSIFQLTWTSNTAHLYSRTSGKRIGEFSYYGEGWGLANDGTWLYMSDGSENIKILDPKTFERKGQITVTLEGEAVNYLNELEWIDGKIWANVYTTDMIVVIDPTSGVVEKLVDLSGLLDSKLHTPSTDVLNGIAYDSTTQKLYVTGKNWSRLFEIELVEK